MLKYSGLLYWFIDFQTRIKYFLSIKKGVILHWFVLWSKQNWNKCWIHYNFTRINVTQSMTQMTQSITYSAAGVLVTVEHATGHTDDFCLHLANVGKHLRVEGVGPRKLSVHLQPHIHQTVQHWCSQTRDWHFTSSWNTSDSLTCSTHIK